MKSSLKFMVMVEMALANVGSHREGAVWFQRFVKVKNEGTVFVGAGQRSKRISKFTFWVLVLNIELDLIAVKIIDHLDKVVDELLLIIECFMLNFIDKSKESFFDNFARLIFSKFFKVHLKLFILRFFWLVVLSSLIRVRSNLFNLDKLIFIAITPLERKTISISRALLSKTRWINSRCTNSRIRIRNFYWRVWHATLSLRNDTLKNWLFRIFLFHLIF